MGLSVRRQKEIWNQTCDARRYQVMNKVLRKLIQKGAAGGSHLHNVYIIWLKDIPSKIFLKSKNVNNV